MSGISNHPQRYQLANELHARPFPTVQAPCVVAYIALDDPDAEAHHQLLSDLLEQFGAKPVQPDVTHYTADLGQTTLKWEKHTEFVTYTLIKPMSDVDYEAAGYAMFPKSWLNKVSLKVITAISVVVHEPQATKPVEKSATTVLDRDFVAESLSVSFVVDKTAVIASDFRIDQHDHIRFALFPIGQVGRNRLGRILQRLLEIETYKAMAMVALPIARDVFDKLNVLDAKLAAAVDRLSNEEESSQEALEDLLAISTGIESLISRHAFRFSATKAYAALVDQRIAVLREERFLGRQMFSEFMMRRFHPAMRTCEAAANRLNDISRRAARASDLLSTRVNVRQNTQNRLLLARMDERADTQLRLQETVEGLSVVAISYYGVNLLSYLLSPIGAKLFGWSSYTVTAIMVLPVVGLVALAIRRIRRKITRHKK